ncbi:MAG TPA: hypothetical protein VFG72_12365 [Marmoricola sp.]|nr:hypothetical protein [Marmoricola sp.]
MIRRGFRPRTGGSVAVGLTTVVAAFVGVAPQTTASADTTAADPADCVSAFPADQLVLDQPVTGLTVTRGTEPEPFGGTYLDTLVDGIAPGVDLIVAELDSEAIAANGIWQGMSGSPVYDPVTGQLIGAVSYALSMGPTPIAGITPAAEMLGMLSAPAPEPLPERVVVPRSLRTSLVASGDATRAQASAGLRRLPTPVAVSGLNQRRFDQLDGWFSEGASVTRAAGSTSTAAAEIAIQPGSNMAASLSHGTVTAAALGTATAVCGDQVVGFGHPLEYAGDTTYSLHGARAVTIQPDPVMSAYKLANLGAPVGTVTEDRLAGLHGVIGSLPTTFEVSATATYRDRSAQGTSHVSVAEWLSDIGLATMASVNDRALDHAGKGGAVASWTIHGLRRNGDPFTVTSGDRYADRYDVAGAPLMDLAYQLYSLTDNTTERVTITSVTTSTSFSDDASRWRIGKAYWKVGGQWQRITARRPVIMKAGTSRVLRVELLSRDHEARFTKLRIAAPANAANRLGQLVLTGGADSEDDFFFFEDEGIMFEEMYGGGAPTTIPELIESFGAEQKNDEIRSTLRVRGAKVTKSTLDVNDVVSGRAILPVAVMR